MSCSHLSHTAMTGKAIVRDIVLRRILSGADMTVFANTGAFQEHHLRVLVTMPRTPLYVIKMVAQEPGTNPAKAIDFCTSAAMARVLIKICRDVTCFHFYDQNIFVKGAPLHDNRKGADRFRRRESVFEVLCERVMFGGDVLLDHVASWFNNYGANSLYGYMLKRGLTHMLACYDIYEKQAFEATEEVVTPLPYQFMIAYHRYTKYLPLTMYKRAMYNKQKTVEASVAVKLDKGFSVGQVQTSLVAEEAKRMFDLENSAEGKRKKRRFQRLSKSGSVAEIWVLINGIFALRCCEELIFSFL
jgi:hypothetical protein